MPFQLRSSAFADHAPIPAKYTADGANVSPPLAWSDAPAGTKSFALLVEDPDAPDPKAPKRIFTHWIVFNLPIDLARLEEGTAPPAAEGVNDWNELGYGGPNPPIGRHRYVFRLFALSRTLDEAVMTRQRLLEEVEGHILGEAVLIGTYEKRRELHA